jgi:hypothetical protein
MAHKKLCVSAKTTALCVSVFLLLSCQNAGRWYPEADVSISGYTEYVDPSAPGGKTLSVMLVVHNTGETSITACAVTVKALTDKRAYLQTTSATVKIVPGGKIALTVAIPYLEAGEQVVANGVSVYNAFFD